MPQQGILANANAGMMHGPTVIMDVEIMVDVWEHNGGFLNATTQLLTAIIDMIYYVRVEHRINILTSYVVNRAAPAIRASGNN